MNRSDPTSGTDRHRAAVDGRIDERCRLPRQPDPGDHPPEPDQRSGGHPDRFAQGQAGTVGHVLVAGGAPPAEKNYVNHSDRSAAPLGAVDFWLDSLRKVVKVFLKNKIRS
jgi:hypothetical protein